VCCPWDVVPAVKDAWHFCLDLLIHVESYSIDRLKRSTRLTHIGEVLFVKSPSLARGDDDGIDGTVGPAEFSHSLDRCRHLLPFTRRVGKGASEDLTPELLVLSP
jgi:hypothetical protein